MITSVFLFKFKSKIRFIFIVRVVINSLVDVPCNRVFSLLPWDLIWRWNLFRIFILDETDGSIRWQLRSLVDGTWSGIIKVRGILIILMLIAYFYLCFFRSLGLVNNNQIIFCAKATLNVSLMLLFLGTVTVYSCTYRFMSLSVSFIMELSLIIKLNFMIMHSWISMFFSEYLNFLFRFILVFNFLPLFSISGILFRFRFLSGVHHWLLFEKEIGKLIHSYNRFHIFFI